MDVLTILPNIFKLFLQIFLRWSQIRPQGIRNESMAYYMTFLCCHVQFSTYLHFQPNLATSGKDQLCGIFAIFRDWIKFGCIDNGCTNNRCICNHFRPHVEGRPGSGRQAGRQKSVRLPKICPVWACATGGAIPCPGLVISPACIRSKQFNFAQKSAHLCIVCQICHILHHFCHARPVLSIPSHYIAKNLSDLASFSRFVPSVASLHCRTKKNPAIGI